MTVYNWLCLFGVPTLLTGVTGYLISQVRNQHKRQISLEEGVKAILRNILVQDYNTYSCQGYVSMDDRDRWENCYQCYEALRGKNGVMEDTRKKLLALPTHKHE